MPDDIERHYCCGKICYSEREANNVLRSCKRTTGHAPRRKSANKVIPKRKYYCEFCGMYHLTSRPYYKE